MSRYDDTFRAQLDHLSIQGKRRTLTPVRKPQAGTVQRDGAAMLDFSSNDYLGLSRHPALIERAASWASLHGAGAGASRLVSGTLDLHQAVEEKLAALKGTEAALLFASGWQANSSVLASLLRLGGNMQVFTDRLNHASLHHGCAAAGVRQIRFRHNDAAHLEHLLKAHADPASRRLIVTESVFSMDGDTADLSALRSLADRYDAFLYIDEAHATGVLGPRGMGLTGALPGGVDLAMGTFSKALGGFGAYVAGSRTLCDWLANHASGFIHTTALPPSVLGAIDAALDVVPGMGAERAHLASLSEKLRALLRKAGLSTGASSTQIVPALVGDERAALALSEALREAGFLAVAIRPPTVPQNTSRLRLAVCAAHTEADIDRLADAVATLWPSRHLAA